MDGDQDQILRQTLDAERQKLTPDQRQKHEHFCEGLRRNETYTPEDAIKAAKIIRTEDGIRQAAELRYLSQRADQHALERDRRAQRDGHDPTQTQAHEAAPRAPSRRSAISPASGGMEAQQQAALGAIRAREAEQARQQQREKQAREQKEREAKEQATRDAAKREPVPKTVQRFDDKIKQAAQQREAQTHAQNIERARTAARTRPNYARHDEMKKQQANAPATPQSEFERNNTPAEKRSDREAAKEKETRDARIALALKDYAPTLTQQRSQGRSGGGGRSR